VRRFTTRNKLFSLALFVVAFGAAQVQAKTDYTGTWKANINKSDFGALPAPDSQTDVITHKEPDLKVNVATSGQMGDMTYDLVFTTDGKECTNDRGDMFKSTSTAKWDGDQLVIDTKGNFNGTDFTSKEKWTLSDDGKTLTLDRHINSAMGEFDQKVLFEKQ
jgi:hypothetical protein